MDSSSIHPVAPRVSIILPTFNRVGFLRRAVGSIVTQTFTDWELIVLNDASTDGTKTYLDELAKKDPRVRPVHHEKNYYPDISRTLNEGIELAQGEYVARLDDDDYWCDDEKLKKQISYLDTHPDYAVVGGGTIVVDENDCERFRYRKPETDAAIRNGALLLNPFTHSTVIFRRVLAQEVGGYGAFNNTEDWDLWLRMGNHGKFYNFPGYFVRYLMTASNKTFLFKRSQSREVLEIVWQHRAEYPHVTKALAVDIVRYLYSFLPLTFRRGFYGLAAKIKNNL